MHINRFISLHLSISLSLSLAFFYSLCSHMCHVPRRTRWTSWEFLRSPRSMPSSVPGRRRCSIICWPDVGPPSGDLRCCRAPIAAPVVVPCRWVSESCGVVCCVVWLAGRMSNKIISILKRFYDATVSALRVTLFIARIWVCLCVCVTCISVSLCVCVY